MHDEAEIPQWLRAPGSPELARKAVAKVSSQAPPKRHWEDRPFWSSCFRPKNPQGDHPPDYVGLMTLNGVKHWCRLWKKITRHGDEFISVNLQPWEER
jgi:hypothetical protein